MAEAPLTIKVEVPELTVALHAEHKALHAYLVGEYLHHVDKRAALWSDLVAAHDRVAALWCRAEGSRAIPPREPKEDGMSDTDSLVAEVTRLDQENEALRRAIGSFRWLGNNLHNSGDRQFRDYYLAALEDARLALGDDWEPFTPWLKAES